MKTQKEIFQTIEADQWYLRNSVSGQNTTIEKDIIIESLKYLEIKPKKILEIGSSDGKRLNNLYKIFGSLCFGIDPSIQAIENGQKKFKNISLEVGTADFLPFADNSFDLIIFGFCLYVCDRKDLFKIAFEADRCLNDKGYLVILDFYPPFPYKNKYTHIEGLFSYKMKYSKMFDWNSSYNEIYNTVFSHSGFSKKNIPDEKIGITILNKNEIDAYPMEPFKE